MASRFVTPRSRARGDDDLRKVIAEYLRDAEAGRALDAAGQRYTPAGLRSVRRALGHVDEALGDMRLSVVEDSDRAAVDGLARRVADHEGLSPSRTGPVVDALNTLFAYVTWQRPAYPLRWERPPRHDPPDPAPPPAGTTTPTFTMLALGAHVGAWIERIIVIAFVLTAIGLALALA
jgi:hypothetical protein